ncbi:hypothetical protein CCL09_01640 [Pseudomonas congelans]|nr:hypothetical protein CCL24_12970 [Pseudomonas congelans]PBQ20827.1 hypothetical protein CCL09_01640 [Pseudomonas congelans]
MLRAFQMTDTMLFRGKSRVIHRCSITTPGTQCAGSTVQIGKSPLLLPRAGNKLLFLQSKPLLHRPLTGGPVSIKVTQ